METLRNWLEDYGWKVLGAAVVVSLIGPAWLGGPADVVLVVAIYCWLAVLCGGIAYFAVCGILRFMANGGRRS